MLQLLGSSSGAAVNIATAAPIGIDLANMAAGTNVIVASAGQLLTWTRGPNGNVSLTTDPTTGLLTASGLVDASGTMILAGANVQANVSALIVDNAAGNATNQPFFSVAADGNMRVGRVGITTGGLEADGNVTAQNVYAGLGTFSATVTAQTVVQTGFVAPASATSACTVGQSGDVSGFHYACVATNTRQRAALASW